MAEASGDFKTFIVFGDGGTVTDIVKSRNGIDDAISPYEFGTQAELDAFLEGVEAASGWSDYENFNTYEEAADHIKSKCEDEDEDEDEE